MNEFVEPKGGILVDSEDPAAEREARRLMQLGKPPLTKKCTRCQMILPVQQFNKTSGRGRVYRRSWCEICLATYYADRQKKIKNQGSPKT